MRRALRNEGVRAAETIPEEVGSSLINALGFCQIT